MSEPAYIRPSDIAIGYTAGIVDGEGYIGVNVKEALFNVIVSQADKNNGRSLMQWLVDTWGFGTIDAVDRVTNLGIQSLMWTWTVNPRRDVLWLLESCEPFFIVKRMKAQQAISIIRETIDDKQRWTAWTQLEDQYLRNNKLATVRSLSEHLNRSPMAVLQRRKLLGLTRSGGKGWRTGIDFTGSDDAQWRTRKWSDVDDQIILSEYATTPLAKLSERMGRTPEALSKRARKLGATRFGGSENKWRPWTPEEDEYLRTFYKAQSRSVTAEHLSRNVGTVTYRAGILGLLTPIDRKGASDDGSSTDPGLPDCAGQQ